MLVRRLLKKLPERERRIVELRFFEGRTQLEIGEQVGLSQVHVSRVLRTSLDRLHQELAAVTSRRRSVFSGRAEMRAPLADEELVEAGHRQDLAEGVGGRADAQVDALERGPVVGEHEGPQPGGVDEAELRRPRRRSRRASRVHSCSVTARSRPDV